MWGRGAGLKQGLAAHTYHPGYLGGRGSRIAVQSWPGQLNETPISTLKGKKEGSGFCSVIEHLLASHT